MLDVVDFDSPDPEAYGRVTNPERFQAVVDAARAMIANLVKTYQVESTPGNWSVDFPDWTAPNTHLHSQRSIGIFVNEKAVGAWREEATRCTCRTSVASLAEALAISSDRHSKSPRHVARCGGVTGADRTDTSVRTPITTGRTTAKAPIHTHGTVTEEASTSPKGPA